MLRPEEVFIIGKNKIHTKYACQLTVDQREYDKRSFIEVSTKFTLPGVLEFYFPEFDDYCQIVLNYVVDLMKTTHMEENKQQTTIYYPKDSLVITKEYVSAETDIGLLDKILQGHIKYVTDPKIIINMLHDILPEVDLVHLELVVSNMFRVEGNESERCRMKGNYNKATIIGVKKQPHEDSWKSALAFQFIEKAIHKGLVDGKATEMNPIEKVLNEDFDDL